MRFVSSDSSLNHVSKVTNSDQLDEVFDRQMAALLANKMASIVISRDGAGLPRKLEADQIHFIRPSQGSTSQQRYDEMRETDFYVESLRRNHKSGYSLLGGSLPTSRVRELAHSVCRGSSTGPGFKWFRITFKSSNHSMMEDLHSKTQYSWPQRTTMLREALAEDPAGYFGVESSLVVEPKRHADRPRRTKTEGTTQEDQSRVVTTKLRDQSAPQWPAQSTLPAVSRVTALFDPKRSYSSVTAMSRPNENTGQVNTGVRNTALLNSVHDTTPVKFHPAGKIILKRPKPAQTSRQDHDFQGELSRAKESSSPPEDVYALGPRETPYSHCEQNPQAAQQYELHMNYNVEADAVRRKIRKTIMSGTILDGSDETLTLQRANCPIPSEDDMTRGTEYVDLRNREDGVNRPYLLETWGPDSTAGTARWKYCASSDELMSAVEFVLGGHDAHRIRASKFDPDYDQSEIPHDPISAAMRPSSAATYSQIKTTASITNRSSGKTRTVKSTDAILPPESHAHRQQAYLFEAIVDRLAIPQQSPGTANYRFTEGLKPMSTVQCPSHSPMGTYSTYSVPASIHYNASGQVAPQMLCSFDPPAQWYSVPVFNQWDSDKYQLSQSWFPGTALQEDQSLSVNRSKMEMEQCASNLPPASSSAAKIPAESLHLLDDKLSLRKPLSGQTSSRRNSIDHLFSNPVSIATVPSKRRSSSLSCSYVFPVTEARPFQIIKSTQDEEDPLRSASGPDELTGEDISAWLTLRGDETLRDAEQQAHLPPGLTALLYRPDHPDRSYIRASFADDDKSDEILAHGNTDTARFSVPTIRVLDFTAPPDSVATVAKPYEGLDIESTDVIEDGPEHVLQISGTRAEVDDESGVGSARLADPSVVPREGADSSTSSDGTSPDGPYETAGVDHNMRQSWADMVESDKTVSSPRRRGSEG